MKRYARLSVGLVIAALVAPAAGQYSPYPQGHYAAPQRGVPVQGQPQQGAFPQGSVPQVVAPQAQQPYVPVQPGTPVHGQPAQAPPQYVVPQGVAPQTPGGQPTYSYELPSHPTAYQPAMGQPTQGYAPPAYQQPRLAQQVGVSALPTPAEMVSDNSDVTPGPMSAAPAPAVEPIPPAYPATAPMAPGVGYEQHIAAPAGYAGDACVIGGCATGGCSTGACSVCPAPDAGYTCAPAVSTGPRRQFFLGIYGLYLGRENPGKATSAFLVDPMPSSGTYYPQPGTDVLFSSTAADVDPTGGGEIRFGTTFGCATDPCTGCQYQPFAWEVGYWGIAEDSSFGELTDTFGGTSRIYGGMNYAGLEYDRDGDGTTYSYRPLNDYYDYQVPPDADKTPDDIRVLAVRVRQSFYAQNVELNFWRFGAGPGGAGLGPAFSAGAGLGSGCGAGGCGVGGCGTSACGAGACNPCGCGPVVKPQRFFLNGLAGVRYLQLDETFRNASFFTVDDGFGGVASGEPTTFPGDMPEDDNTLFHDVEVDNDLVGFQLGCGMSYLVSCRCSLFADTNFGVYNNRIEKYQRVYSTGGGPVRFVGTGGDAEVRTETDEIAFLGELRTGIGYQITSHCRLTGAYRLIAASGVANAVDQIGPPINESEFGHIDSNGSLLLHGFQGGVEFCY